MPESNRILCRETSLLAFNRRVLAQAWDESLPLLERLRFLCIVSSNLDEFFEVRMARLKRQEREQPDILFDSGLTPAQTIAAVGAEAKKLIGEQYRLFNDVLVPALERENIRFVRRKDWTRLDRRLFQPRTAAHSHAHRFGRFPPVPAPAQQITQFSGRTQRQRRFRPRFGHGGGAGAAHFAARGAAA